jgi:hypothetical protein
MADIIHDLELSVRATNVLTTYGRVKTLEDFLALNRKTVMALPRAGVRTWEEIKRVQANLRREEKQEPGAIFAPPDLPTRMFNETRRHMQRMEFYQGRQTAALETLAQEVTMPTQQPAMSLRDAAALAALQGILANPNDNYGPENMRYAASYAWQAADAFIAAREGKSK